MAVFEMLYGVGGLVYILGGVIGIMPAAAISLVWYGVFPLLNIAAGFLLWREWRQALLLSALVQLAQAVYIRSADLNYNPSAPFQFTLGGYGTCAPDRTQLLRTLIS